VPHHPQIIRAETAAALYTDVKKPPILPDAGKLLTTIQEERRKKADDDIAQVRGMVATAQFGGQSGGGGLAWI